MATVGCKSCGHVFELTKQRHYIAREKTEMFLIASNKMEPTLYDAFDCPICGYQYCENCGAPLTDEAVDIRLKELEVLKDGKSD